MTRRTDATVRRIAHVLRDWPGLHLHAVAREARMSAPLVAHHLTALEIQGEASSIRMGRRRHYFLRDVPAGSFERIAILRQPLPFALLLSLLHQGPATHGALKQDLKFTGSTIHYHLARLDQMGFVRHPAAGSSYELARPLDIQMMMRRYPPTRELLNAFSDLWDRFLRGSTGTTSTNDGRTRVYKEGA